MTGVQTCALPICSIQISDDPADTDISIDGNTGITGDLSVTDTIKVGNSGVGLYDGGVNKFYMKNAIGDGMGITSKSLSLSYGGTSLTMDGTESNFSGLLTASNNLKVTDTIFMNGTFTSPTDTCSGFINMTDIGNLDLSNSTNPLNTIYCKELSLEEGANAAMGAVALIGGTLTVNTTKVTVNSRIFLTSQDCTNCGWIYISARVVGTSFTITSSNALDTSTIAWMIVEPN